MQSPDKQNSPRVKLCVPSDIHCPLCKQAHIDSTYQALWAIIGPDNRSACWRCLRRHYPQIWRFLEWFGRSSCANDEEASTLPRVGTSQDPKLVENLLAHRKKYGISFEPRARAYEIITDDAELVQRIGQPVTVVTGSPINLKITTKADLQLAANALNALPKPKLPGASHPFADDDLWR